MDVPKTERKILMTLNEYHDLIDSKVFKALYGGSKPVFTITDTFGYTSFFDELIGDHYHTILKLNGEYNRDFINLGELNIKFASDNGLQWQGKIYTGVKK